MSIYGRFKLVSSPLPPWDCGLLLAWGLCCWLLRPCVWPVLLLLLFGSAVIRSVSAAKRWAESSTALWSFVGASLSWLSRVGVNVEVLGRRWYHHHLSHNKCQPPIQAQGSRYWPSNITPASLPVVLLILPLSVCAHILHHHRSGCPQPPSLTLVCPSLAAVTAVSWQHQAWPRAGDGPGELSSERFEDEQTPARPDQRRYAEPHSRGKTGSASPDRAEILLGCIPGIHLRVARSVFHAVSHTVNLWAYLGGVSLFS